MRAGTIRTSVPRPNRCRTRIDELGSQLELSSRRFSAGQRCAVVLIAAWLIGWSAGSMLLLGHVAADPALMSVLFATPFNTSWFAVSGVLVGLLFGHQRLPLEPQGLDYEFRAYLYDASGGSLLGNESSSVH